MLICGKKYIDLIDEESSDDEDYKFYIEWFRPRYDVYIYRGQGFVFCQCCNRTTHAGYIKLHNKSKLHKNNLEKWRKKYIV